MENAMRKLMVLGVLLFMSGCGARSAPTAHLAGAVMIKGQPVPADAEAALSFQPAQGGEAVSATITNGRYDVPNAPLGTVQVLFYISQPVGPTKVSERTGKEFRESSNLVPPEYGAGKTIEITGDNENQDFNL